MAPKNKARADKAAKKKTKPKSAPGARARALAGGAATRVAEAAPSYPVIDPPVTEAMDVNAAAARDDRARAKKAKDAKATKPGKAKAAKPAKGAKPAKSTKLAKQGKQAKREKPAESQAAARSSHLVTEAPPVEVLGAASLRMLAIPSTRGGAKDSRVFVIGGSTQMPGALILAVQAALRAGAAKVQMATVRAVASLCAVAIPEARVFRIEATRGGAIDSVGSRDLADRMKGVGALLVGPGMVEPREVERFVGRLVSRLDPKRGPVLILDAEGLGVLQKFPDILRRLVGRAIVTPHLAALANMLGIERGEVRRDPLAAARQAAREWRAVVALKAGAETFVVAPDGRALSNTASHAGLGTAGPSDTLAGVIAGIAARGGAPFESAAWGVYAHARAAEAIAKKIGPAGFFARELLDEVPRELAAAEKAADALVDSRLGDDGKPSSTLVFPRSN